MCMGQGVALMAVKSEAKSSMAVVQQQQQQQQKQSAQAPDGPQAQAQGEHGEQGGGAVGAARPGLVVYTKDAVRGQSRLDTFARGHQDTRQTVAASTEASSCVDAAVAEDAQDADAACHDEAHAEGGGEEAVGEDTGGAGMDKLKINMLLAHPVVVRAMQDPRLDEILSRMLAAGDVGAAGDGDAQLLALVSKDADMLQLYHTVARIMNTTSSTSILPSARQAHNISSRGLGHSVARLRGGGTSLSSACDEDDLDCEDDIDVEDEGVDVDQDHVQDEDGMEDQDEHARMTEREAEAQRNCESFWEEAVKISPVEILHAKSSSGNLVPVEFVPSPTRGKASAEMPVPEAREASSAGLEAPPLVPLVGGARDESEQAAPRDEREASEVVEDLNDLAHEFPGCARYLMKELDSRRCCPAPLPFAPSRATTPLIPFLF